VIRTLIFEGEDGREVRAVRVDNEFQLAWGFIVV
jgi:hypothetical protein